MQAEKRSRPRKGCERWNWDSNYPPAEPGALKMGPLKAARIDMKFPTKHLGTAHASLTPNSLTSQR
ncbi:hypothetical protein, partial [Bradyrhizobium sp.]|uniref:hypothetical protein n=1 Tax=Bradyrhizobium sp. TaxID=376 RepID=UPI002635CF44